MYVRAVWGLRVLYANVGSSTAEGNSLFSFLNFFLPSIKHIYFFVYYSKEPSTYIWYPECRSLLHLLRNQHVH